MNTVVVVAMLNVFFPIAAIVATRSAFKDEKMRSQSIGFISAGLNIIMYGSPLSAMVSSFLILPHLSKHFIIAFWYFISPTFCNKRCHCSYPLAPFWNCIKLIDYNFYFLSILQTKTTYLVWRFNFCIQT